MRKVLVLIALTTASYWLAPSSASELSTQAASLEIKAGGGLTGPFFSVSLSSSGRLSVKKESLPFAKTESGLTTKIYTIQLTAAQAHQIIDLAHSANDFSKDCELVEHGTTARMNLRIDGHLLEFVCRNAPNWPAGPQTKELLMAVNQHLPKSFHVF